MMLPNVALSIRQPWCAAIVHGTKRIENRAWTGSHRRGPFLIHAAQGCTQKEYAEAHSFCASRHLTLATKYDELLRGGIVGMATITGVVLPSQLPMFDKRKESWRVYEGDTRKLRTCAVRPLSTSEYAWWAGGFALVLSDVRPLPFTPCKGSLGFFKVSNEIMHKLNVEMADADVCRQGVARAARGVGR